jgi:(2Fe-2S) ferredoxin
MPKFQVLVCDGPTCGAKRGGGQLLVELRRLVAERGLEGAVEVGRETCFGYCQRGPNVVIQGIEGPAEGTPAARPDAGGILYTRLTLGEIPLLVERHLVGGQIVWQLVGRPEDRGGGSGK